MNKAANEIKEKIQELKGIASKAAREIVILAAALRILVTDHPEISGTALEETVEVISRDRSTLNGPEPEKGPSDPEQTNEISGNGSGTALEEAVVGRPGIRTAFAEAPDEINEAPEPDAEEPPLTAKARDFWRYRRRTAEFNFVLGDMFDHIKELWPETPDKLRGQLSAILNQLQAKGAVERVRFRRGGAGFVGGWKIVEDFDMPGEDDIGPGRVY